MSSAAPISSGCRDNRQRAVSFEQVQNFGPPAKDFRWCCKTNKLGPMTSFLEQHYPKGCVTIEGRRIYESFNRSTIKAVERNPYVPSQTTLSPIRNWRALEVMLYIYWNQAGAKSALRGGLRAHRLLALPRLSAV